MEFLRRLFASKRHPYVPFRDRLETVSTSLSGTRFSIELPPNSVSDIDPENPPPSIDIYDPSIYLPIQDVKWYQVGDHAAAPILKRNWGFRGAIWERHEIGYLGINVLANRVDDLPKSMTCLAPQHFEQVVLRALYFRYGPPREMPDKQGYLVPVNWQVMRINEHDWIYCEAHRDLSHCAPEPGEGSNYHCHLFTPLEDYQYLDVTFHCSAYSPVSLGTKSLTELMRPIINSIRIALPASVEQRRQQLLNQFPEQTYSPTRPNENWIYHEWDYGDQAAGEDFKVVVKRGTPPPAFRY